MWWIAIARAGAPVEGCTRMEAAERMLAEGAADDPDRPDHLAAWSCDERRVTIVALEGPLPAAEGETAAKRMGRTAGELLTGYRCPATRVPCPALNEDPTFRVEPSLLDSDPENIVAALHFWHDETNAEGWLTARQLPKDRARWVMCIGPTGTDACRARAERLATDKRLFTRR